VTDLAALVESTRQAAPDRRIESRDAIAAHGAAGIEAMKPWLTDEVLAAFAIRVIELAGVNGETELATKVLRASRTKVPAAVSGDVDWSLARLRAVSHPKAVPAAPVAPVRAVPTRSTSSARRRPAR